MRVVLHWVNACYRIQLHIGIYLIYFGALIPYSECMGMNIKP